MIKGMHGIFYTPQAEADRAFVREAFGLPEADAGDGWLIFGLPQAEFAFHPGEDRHAGLAFWCDDIEETVKELTAKGVEFKTPITDQGYGLATTLLLPGGSEINLYEPRHPQPPAS